jgi:Tfp pilus assembly protein PilN
MTTNNDLSFLPDDYLDRKVRRRTTIIFGSLFLVVAVCVVLVVQTTMGARRAEEKKNSDVTDKFVEAAKRIDQVKKMHDQQRKIVQHAELAAALVEKVPRSNLLAELTNSLPSGTSLLEFSLEAKEHHEVAASTFDQKKAALEAQRKVETTGAGETPKFDVFMKLQGVATTDVQVAQYISKLNRSTFLKDVNLVISEAYKSGGDNVRRFEIEMMLNPDAEVKDPSKALRTAATELSK